MPRTAVKPWKSIWSAACLTAAALLSACGGGGDSAADTGSAGATAYTLTGIAAVGAPLAGTSIKAWCGSELAASTTTDAGGHYQMQLARLCSSPWMLQASDGSGGTLNVFSDVKAPSPSTLTGVFAANITPVTNVLTQVALQASGFQDLLARAGQLAHPDPTGQKDMVDRMQAMLDIINEGRPSGTDPATLDMVMHQQFLPQPGDPMDDLLEAFGQQRGTVTGDALVEQVDLRGGDLASGQPWKTLFGDRSTLTLSATDCAPSGGAGPVAPATATLRMQDKDLEVTLISSLLSASVTFVVGPAGSSEFDMVLDGASPLVRLRASAGGNTLDVFAVAGVAKLSFSVAGNGATCTLSTPVRRADLVAFQPAARIRSVIPTAGASGICAASAAGAAYGYAISPLGDVRFDGTSLPADWLERANAYYSESLQYGMGGPGPSYQLQLSVLPTGQGIQGYYFSTVPYGVNCTASNP